MMKKILNIGLVLAVLAINPIMSQAQSSEATVSYNKANANGFVVNVEGEKSVVATSLEEYFKKTFGSKSSSTKGYKLYKAVSWPEVSTDKMDVYYKVENKKNNNKVTMLVSKGYDNFVSGQSDPQMAAAIINFMNSIQSKAIVVSNANAVVAAEKALVDAQKEFDKSVKKDEDLRKEKEKIEKEIASQQKTIGDKEKALAAAKAALDAAKSK